jgi:hypothetical protein
MPAPRDQAMYVKQGRYIDFGFEPCANAFFDFYVNPKYVDPPLLDIQDVGFFLFLRKNVNPKSPKWKMPSIRQMKVRLGVGQDRITAIMKRLEHTGLLVKDSGIGRGEKGENISNDYLLSDPLPTLVEFLYAFKEELKEEWKAYLESLDPVPEMGTGGVPEMGTSVPKTGTAGVPDSDTHKQTSYKQTEWDDIWSSVLEILKSQLPQSTYYSFMESTRLVELCNGAATLALPNVKAKDWIENRLARQLKQLLSIEGKMKVEEIHVVIESQA